MDIHVGTDNPLKVAATQAAFAVVFSDQELTVTGVHVDTSVSPQPIDADVSTGAIARARAARGEAAFGVGIEAGIVRLPGCNRYLNIQVCAVIDHTGALAIGTSPGFELPPPVVQQLLHGIELNHEMSRIAGIADIKQTIGAVGYLSAGKTDRFTLTYTAVLMALIPYIRRDLFVT